MFCVEFVKHIKDTLIARGAVPARNQELIAQRAWDHIRQLRQEHHSLSIGNGDLPSSLGPQSRGCPDEGLLRDAVRSSEENSPALWDLQGKVINERMVVF